MTSTQMCRSLSSDTCRESLMKMDQGKGKALRGQRKMRMRVSLCFTWSRSLNPQLGALSAIYAADFRSLLVLFLVRRPRVMGCPQCLHPAINVCRSVYHLTHAGTQISIYIQSSTLILPGLAASSTPKLPFSLALDDFRKKTCL